MDQLSSPVMQDDEAEQHPQCDRRNDEEINGGDGLGVIVQEGPVGRKKLIRGTSF
jgi:hypothetical protein